MSGSSLQTDRPRRPKIAIAAGIAAILWIALSVLVLLPMQTTGWFGGILFVAMPLALIAISAFLASLVGSLREEADALRHELEVIRRARAELDAQPPAHSLSEAVPVTPPPPRQPQPQPERTSGQGSFALDAEMRAPEPLTVMDLLRALHFPETPDDKEGFRAMQLALRDHLAGQVIQAAQDVLTLLSQDGIYMDDLVPDPPKVGLWRQFARGTRGEAISEMATIKDEQALETCSARLRENAVFRDAAHHFVRRFDRMLADLEPELDDEALALLADTRSARAFLLLAESIGVFG